MKCPVLLLLLVFFCPYSSSDTVASFEKANCLTRVNQLRKMVADDKQIANMNYLIYDDELEKVANEPVSKQDCFTDVLKTAEFDSMRDSKSNMNVSAFLSVPGKTKLACIRKVCTRPDQELILVTDLGSGEPPKTGPPGTACPAGRPKNDHDMCSAPMALPVSDPPIPTVPADEPDSATSSRLVVALMTVLLGGFL